MPIPISIVLYGQDTHLLQSRRMLVQKLGYSVSPVADISQLQQICSATRVDLLILCHTLTPQERGHAISLVESTSPNAKVLCLESADSIGQTDCGERLSTTEGPARLLSTVQELVTGAAAAGMSH